MNRIEAWKFLKSKFADFAYGAPKDEYTMLGLCWAVKQLRFNNLISVHVKDQMLDDISQGEPKDAKPYRYWSDLGAPGARDRAKWIGRLLEKLEANK